MVIASGRDGERRTNTITKGLPFPACVILIFTTQVIVIAISSLVLGGAIDTYLCFKMHSPKKSNQRENVDEAPAPPIAAPAPAAAAPTATEELFAKR